MAARLGLFESWGCEELAPNVITYSATISACEQGQQWQRAFDVLSRGRVDGISYGTAIRICEKAR